MSDRSLLQLEYQNVEQGCFLKAPMSETPEAIKIMESNNNNNNNINNINNDVQKKNFNCADDVLK